MGFKLPERLFISSGYSGGGGDCGNEPDIGEMGGTPHYFRSAADYIRLYSHTVAGLPRGDPEARVGGPAVAGADSFLVEGLIEHCATQGVPLHFLSWHPLQHDDADGSAVIREGSPTAG
jgi:hypothetical protein